MASTYTVNKGRLEKPANGDYTGTWDTVVNSDWDGIDTALGGSTTVALTNVDVNLSNAQTQNLRILLTGALSGNVNIKFPSTVGGSWIISNNTTNAFTVTVKTTAGGSTGVVAQQGLSTLVVSDGTNVIKGDDGGAPQMVGDSGSGGTKGLVPAPAAGDAAAHKFLKADGTWKGNATSQSTSANPLSTISGTGVMMGLAGSVTPTNSGRVLIIVSGTVSNNTGGAGAQVRLRYGTGAAPANGAALTGTTVGPTMLTSQMTSSAEVPFSVQGVVTGLALNTAHWIDLSLATSGGGTADIDACSISAVEI